MAQPHVKIIGQKAVDRTLRKMSNPTPFVDSSVRITALTSIKDLVEGSQTKQPKTKTFSFGGEQVTAHRLTTGDTARGWTQPRRIKPAVYSVINRKRTDDNKHNVVDIIDKGTKTDIRPKKSGGRLYIPLTQKGKNKSGELDMFKDFIWVKKVKKRKGTNFLDKISRKYSIFLTRLIIQKIRAEVARK